MVWAHVFMPEHAHRIVKAIKQPVGRRAILYLDSHAPRWLPRITRIRSGRPERPFWQSGGGHDRNVVEPQTLPSMIDDVHQNPVRRGLVARATDWTWSGAAWFAGQGRNSLRPDPIPPGWLA